MDRETLRMVREEVTRIQLENRNRETSLGKERKTIMGGEEKIDFFPQWKPPKGVVEEEEEEEEQHMTIDENGRPYISVRRKLRDKQEKEGQEWRPMQGVVEENKEEEEQYMTIREDGRPYIAVRIRKRQDNVDSKGSQTSRHT